jgi:hypothetical protein
MAFTAVANTSNLDLASFLKIYQSNGVYNNLATQSDLWKYFLKLRARGAEGRSLKYLLRTGYGPGAVQSLAIDEGAYPAAQRSDLQEASAQYKDFGVTISVPKSLLGRTGNDLVQYADPLTEELDAKAIASARVMSAQTMGDGSGVIGVIEGTPSTSATLITVVLDTTNAAAGRSHIGWFMEGDKVKFASTAGAAQDAANTGADGAYYQVESVNADTDTITLSWRTSAGVALTDITGAGTLSDGDYIYRFGTTPNDYSGAVSDYGTASECIVGLESLAADDGRVVNGLTMSGTLAGSWKDASGAAIDPSHFQSALSKAKRRAGKGRYKYKQAFMFDTVYDALVEANETDRRFQVGDPGNRGFKSLGYQHQQDFVEFVTDEFVSKKRIWILPESKEVLEFHGKDFEVVEVNKGQKFHMGINGDGLNTRTVKSYMEGSAVVVCKHPAAIIAIENFSV